jgi:DNA-binding NarL/FixJ family response regulator
LEGSEKKIRVIIADDHSVVREGIRRILEMSKSIEILGTGSDGKQAWDLIDSHQPDVAILDIRMPVFTGIELIERINDTGYATRVLILTNYDNQEYVLDAMSKGAAGYLMKSVEPETLIGSVEAIFTGETVLDPSIAVGLGKSWSRRQQRGSFQIGMDSLTEREKETLALACKGMRNRSISEDMGISVRTVEGHFNSIYSKLGITSRIEAVLQAVAIESR